MTIYGWDQSHFDAPSIGTALSEGISFITHKAGGDAPDAEVAAWWSGVKSLRSKVLLGAYWVQYPGNPVGRADAFLARLDSQCPGWRTGPFILQVDCEKWNSNAATVPSRAEIKAFCDRLAGAMPKLVPIVYAPKWVYGDTLTGLGYPLWASAYVNGSGGFKALYPGDASSKWGAYSGQTPAILQYTSSATIGGQTTCDANAFRGTLKELTALVAPGWIEDDMPLNGDDKKFITDAVAAAVKPLGTQAAIVDAVWNKLIDIDVTAAGVSNQKAGDVLRYTSSEHAAIRADVAKVSASLSSLAAKDMTDEPAIVAGVLAGLNPETIAAAIPPTMAQQIVDLLSARLAS